MQALVEALVSKGPKGRNGAVYLPDLFAYVSRTVKERTAGKEGAAVPYACDLSQFSDLPISKP